MRRFLVLLIALAALPAAPATAAPSASNSSQAAPVRDGVVTLRPERSFSLVGFSWRGPTPDLEVRARGRDGRWTRWAEVPTEVADGPDRGAGRRSAPVWTGPARRLQYRLHEQPRRLRARFVRIRGKASKAPRPLARASASDASGVPPIVPRSSWDPRGQCRPRSSPDYGQVKVAFVHHTVTLNEYTPEQAAGIVLGICRYHRNSNGWNDIGYNFLVDKYGTLYEGRAGGIDRPVVGAQTQGFNSQSTGISNIGSHESVPQSDAALEAMAALIRWKLPLEGAATSGSVPVTSAGGSASRYPAGRTVYLDRVSGHRDGNHTACPGAALYEQLPTLRAMVAGAGPAAPDGEISMSADRSAVTYGDLVLLRGTAVSAGAPLSGAPISFGLAYGNGRARAARSPITTRSDGSFLARIRARYRGSVTAHAGGIASAPLALEVAADLDAALLAADVRRRERVVVAGSVRRGSKARTRVVVRQITESGAREVKRRKLRPARRGSFRVRMRLRRPGDYRVIVVSPTNRINRGSVVRLPLRVR